MASLFPPSMAPHAHPFQAPSLPVLPDLPAPVRQRIIEECAVGFGYYHVSNLFHSGSSTFVKHMGDRLVPEAHTQAYVYQLAQSDPAAPGVPEVYGCFQDGFSTYLVMADIPAVSFHAWISQEGLSDEERHSRTAIAVDKIATTVSWLLTRPPPSDDRIGPIGGGRIQHRFFAMDEAAVPFVDSAALEKFVNKALTRLPGRVQRTVELKNEKLVIGHLDITTNNFLYDLDTGRVWMIDYGHVNVVPASFVSFYLHFSADSFGLAVAERIDFPRSSQLLFLELAAFNILQSGNSGLGLDMYGNPRPRKRRSEHKT